MTNDQHRMAIVRPACGDQDMRGGGTRQQFGHDLNLPVEGFRGFPRAHRRADQNPGRIGQVAFQPRRHARGLLLAFAGESALEIGLTFVFHRHRIGVPPEYQIHRQTIVGDCDGVKSIRRGCAHAFALVIARHRREIFAPYCEGLLIGRPLSVRTRLYEESWRLVEFVFTTHTSATMTSNFFLRHFVALSTALLLSVFAAIPATAKTSPKDAALPANAKLMDISLAAGRVRASSQRVARLYLESAFRHRPERTRIAIEREIGDVESALAALGKFTPEDDKAKRDLRRALESLNQFWAELKPIIATKHEGRHSQTAYDISEQMYIYASKITFLFEGIGNSEASYMVDVAGRMQVTSERIAKAAIHGIASRRAGAASDFIAWKKEFLAAYSEVSASPLNDDYQTRMLDLGRTLWSFYDAVVTEAVARADATRILEISKCADGMWDVAQSSQTTYVMAFKSGAKSQTVARTGNRAS